MLQLPLSLLAQTNGGLESATSALADPNVAYLLLVLGFLGLFLELSSPGTSIPGAFGVISLGLAPQTSHWPRGPGRRGRHRPPTTRSRWACIRLRRALAGDRPRRQRCR